MPIATSPYTPNDYKAVSNYRPYELPINDIYKAIDAQNKFWDMGAERVKQVYENALDMPLTLNENKEVRRQYMEKAQKELTKLSTMNLSDPSVQRKGFNLFTPLFKDESIAYDSELTKTMNSIYNDANSYRRSKLSSTGPEGEGYTQRNLAYALDGFEEFNADTPRDPSLLKDLHAKLGSKKYMPYYNPQQEYDSILKHCKGSGSEKQDVASNYLYFDGTSKSGASPSETANCFMMGLSDKAKEQIGIDGWAYYKMNPHLLVEDHHSYALGPQKGALDGIKGKIAAYENITNPSKEDKEILKQLKDMLPDLQKSYDDREKEYTQMVGGNADNYIKGNFNQIAAGIYLSKQYLDLGEAFKSDKVSHKVTANASGIAQFNAIEKFYAQEREHQYRMLEMQEKYKLDVKIKQAAGEIPMDNVGMFHPKVTEATDTNQGYNEQAFLNDQTAAHNVFEEANNTLKGYIKSKDPSATGEEYYLNYANEQSKLPEEKRDKRFIELMTAYNNAKGVVSVMDVRQKSINTIVNDQISKEQQAVLNEVISLSDGNTLQVKDAINIWKSRITETQTQTGFTSGGSRPTTQTITVGFNFNGKTYKENDKDFWKISDAIKKYTKTVEPYQKIKDNLYNKSYYDAHGFTTPRIDPKKYANGAVEQMIQNTLGVRGGEDGKTGYKLLGHDENGQNLIVIPLDAEGNEVSADLERATQYERNVEPVNIGGKQALKIPYRLPEIPDLPNVAQRTQINNLREFQVLMESMLKNKSGYVSSEDLKTNDGTSFPYSTFSFETPSGGKVKVSAIRANGRIMLAPSRQLPDGSWDDNYSSFSTPEEVILYFRKDTKK